MENTVFGVALTVAAPFAVLGIASVARKFGVGGEGSRKLVHILLSNWILLAIAVYNGAWTSCIIPACFIPLNYLSYRKKIFSAIERDKDSTPGTVWYAVSLFLLCLAGYYSGMPWIAACGMLAMGYGDGFGAIIGKLRGKLYFPGNHSKKTLEGTLTVMLFSGLAVGFVCAVYAPGDASVIAISAPRFALFAGLLCAVPASVIEMFSPRGIDNLTLPLGVSLIVFLLARFPFLRGFFACLSIELFILILAYYARSVTFGAFAAATILGALLFAFGGWVSFVSVILFFLSGSAVSRIGKKKKHSAYDLHERRGARNVAQVAANGLAPLIFAVFYYITARESFLIAVIACFAAANADTFSSEIGMLSKKKPVSVLNFKPVQKGLSGGVTPLGFSAAAIGALIISVLAAPKFGVAGMTAVIVMGILSSALDSVFGAAFQAKYLTRGSDGEEEKATEQRLTEKKDFENMPLKLARGIKWVNNDAVNFASVFICGAFLSIVW